MDVDDGDLLFLSLRRLAGGSSVEERLDSLRARQATLSGILLSFLPPVLIELDCFRTVTRKNSQEDLKIEIG